MALAPLELPDPSAPACLTALAKDLLELALREPGRSHRATALLMVSMMNARLALPKVRHVLKRAARELNEADPQRFSDTVHDLNTLGSSFTPVVELPLLKQRLPEQQKAPAR